MGGWLVIERWMTPSLFKDSSAANEYQLSSTSVGRDRIKKHHKSFITEKDLDWLVAQAIEIVRIPVGHWVLCGSDRYVSAAHRLDWLMEQTKKRHIKVLIDLHAAPGAQNRYMHSGSGNQHHDEHWLKSEESQTLTVTTLKQLAKRYADYENLWGIQLLNEPDVGLTGWRLVRFYRRAYQQVTKVLPARVLVIFSDGYAPFLLTGALSWPHRRTNPVAMDSHFYQTFGKRNKRRQLHEHLKVARRRRWWIRIWTLSQPLIVGEWSTTLPYKVSDEHTKQYQVIQNSSHSSALATFYWSYKTESIGKWNYRWMIDNNKLVQ